MVLLTNRSLHLRAPAPRRPWPTRSARPCLWEASRAAWGAVRASSVPRSLGQRAGSRLSCAHATRARVANLGGTKRCSRQTGNAGGTMASNPTAAQRLMEAGMTKSGSGSRVMFTDNGQEKEITVDFRLSSCACVRGGRGAATRSLAALPPLQRLDAPSCPLRRRWRGWTAG